MKFLAGLVILFAAFLMLFNLIAFGVSITSWSSMTCQPPWKRGIVLVPAYRLGCWLSEVPDEH
jgi:hypothetical protein